MSIANLRWGSPLAEIRPYRGKRGAPWGNRNAARPKTLSPREMQIAERIAAGHRTKQIAADLGISESSVKVYIWQACKKVNVANRLELALWYWGQFNKPVGPFSNTQMDDYWRSRLGFPDESVSAGVFE